MTARSCFPLEQRRSNQHACGELSNRCLNIDSCDKFLREGDQYSRFLLTTAVARPGSTLHVLTCLSRARDEDCASTDRHIAAPGSISARNSRGTWIHDDPTSVVDVSMP